MPCSGPGFESWRRHPRKSFKNLQKSSKSEKIEVRETRGPVYRPSRLVYRTSVTFTAFFVLFTAFLSCLHDALRRSVSKWSPVLKTLRRGALLTLPCGTRTLRFWCERWLFNSQHERPATLYIRSHNFSTAATLATLTLCLPMLARLGTLACERHLRMRHPNVPTRERCHWEGSQGERRNVPWPSERALCQKGPARDLYLGLRVPT